jgi:acyl-CoA thioester hydrolase
MKPDDIPLKSILSLQPACWRMPVPQAYRDSNGHMNVRWYAAIFDDAGDPLHERLGLTPEFHEARGTGTMDLENHFSYVHEVMAGDRLAVYARLVARSPKRMHYLMFMGNETRDRLAAIFECVNSFVDLKVRKTAPFPEEIAARIDAEVAAGAALDWPPPVCGVMSPERITGTRKGQGTHDAS